MDQKEQAQELILALGRKMGIADLAFGEDGMIVFEIDTAMTLAIGVEPDTDAITLYAPLHGSAGNRGSGLLEQLLVANFLWQATQGATLALDPTTNHVVQQQRLPLAGLSQEVFEQHVESFANTLQAMTLQVSDALQGGETSTLASDAAPPPGSLRV